MADTSIENLPDKPTSVKSPPMSPSKGAVASAPKAGHPPPLAPGASSAAAAKAGHPPASGASSAAKAGQLPASGASSAAQEGPPPAKAAAAAPPHPRFRRCTATPRSPRGSRRGRRWKARQCRCCGRCGEGACGCRGGCRKCGPPPLWRALPRCRCRCPAHRHGVGQRGYSEAHSCRGGGCKDKRREAQAR